MHVNASAANISQGRAEVDEKTFYAKHIIVNKHISF